MIILKTSRELELMREAGRISHLALMAGVRAVQPGATTMDVNRAVHETITSLGGKPSFLGYGGFPAAACVSINDEVIHGIPTKRRKIQEGDIVSIDTGAIYQGFHGDNAFTVAAGETSQRCRELMEVTQRCLELAIAAALPGNRLGDIGAAVEEYARSHGFGVVKEYVGHGIGSEMHQEPEVPNYGRAGHGQRLRPGMTLAIEPMINMEGDGVWKDKKDGWTIHTASGLPSAHFENTVAITENGPVVLTRP
ncbi:MAG: type I methionyl aminopeptidase [Angelakisella sp.]|jgi:methionyl aminopeptidase|nr:type I methionyl aminopeptidase [Angelakisella sp.]MCI9528196.1 type I methionyl aminopeptidase [Angelakisella sp.]